jgi:ADP-heptose:LPS heptosyltransferase
MASPAGSQAASLLPWIDEVITQRVVWQDASGNMPLDPQREFSLLEQIRSQRYDAAFIFTSFAQSPYPPAYLCYMAGIPIRIGQSKEFGGSVLSHWKKSVPDEVHQVDRNLSLVVFAGLPLAGRDLELRIPETVQHRADRLLHSVGIDPYEAFAALAPGASCAARRYDPARFARAAGLLQAQTGLPIVLLGSAKEKDLAQPFTLGDSRVVSLFGQTSVQEMAAILRRSALVLANDSAPMHLADAFLRPMVILYSGTELESQWEPRSAPARLLRRSTPCSPCYSFQCPFQMECLDIPPEEVAAEAIQLLSTIPVGKGTRTLTCAS